MLLVIGLGIWYYLRKRKHKPELLVQSALSPFEEAMQELEKLNGYDMVKHDEVKLYHTRLSDIFKRYFGRKQNLNLANSTTGDLLIQLSVQNHLPETISNLATALRCNDAVKFAKFIPLPFERTLPFNFFPFT